MKGVPHNRFGMVMLAKYTKGMSQGEDANLIDLLWGCYVVFEWTV
jgi:hypothetical protein